VTDNTTHGQRAQTQSRVAREPIPLGERAAYSPAEFAALCGKSATWAYRRLYAGQLKAITSFGRLLIPRSELDALLATKESYTGARAQSK
jgi:hypothetical protein